MKKNINILLILLLSRTIIGQDATVIYKNTVSSTVTIETDIGLGSGFFISENVIVTNYHVINGASETYCYTNNSSEKYKIDGYLAVDKSADLILLKVSCLNRAAIKIALGSVTPGQRVYVIGSPKGLPATISDGIISGLRDFEGQKLIQITAPVSPGSSGGPVLNENGELIGVSVGQISEGQNLNFAIPLSYLESLLKLMTFNAISIIELNPKNYFFVDERDGQTYKIVKIGTQLWMAENLRATEFNNGTPIPQVTDDSEWQHLNTPAYCWYNNDVDNYKVTYGPLYNYYTVYSGKLCPIGWHVPDDEEWTTLANFFGGTYLGYSTNKDPDTGRILFTIPYYTVAGGKLKEVGTTHWQAPNTGATNESGFSAVPGGYRDLKGPFYHVGYNGVWWSATTPDNTSPAQVTASQWSVNYASNDLYKHYFEKQVGLSVRCVKNN